MSHFCKFQYPDCLQNTCYMSWYHLICKTFLHLIQNSNCVSYIFCWRDNLPSSGFQFCRSDNCIMHLKLWYLRSNSLLLFLFLAFQFLWCSLSVVFCICLLNRRLCFQNVLYLQKNKYHFNIFGGICGFLKPI